MKKKLTDEEFVRAVFIVIGFFMLLSASIKISSSKCFRTPLPLSYSKLDKIIDKVYEAAFYELEYAERDLFEIEYNKALDSIRDVYNKAANEALFKRDSCYNLVAFYDRKLKLIKDSINNSLKVANDTLNIDSVYNALNIENDMLKKDSVFNAMRKESDTTKLGEQLRKCVDVYNNTLFLAENYHLDALEHYNNRLINVFSYMDTHKHQDKYPESLLFKSDEYRSQKIKELVLRRARFKHSLKNNEKKGR